MLICLCPTLLAACHCGCACRRANGTAQALLTKARETQEFIVEAVGEGAIQQAVRALALLSNMAVSELGKHVTVCSDTRSSWDQSFKREGVCVCGWRGDDAD